MPSARREFLMSAAALSAQTVAAGIPRRPLGKTGLEVSILGLGGAPIGRLAQEKDAIDVVRLCYDLGVNYFDSAAAGAYGLSQSRYGAALHDVRGKVVIGTKTRHRTYTQAEVDLNQSLANLRTDYLDLYQIHNVTNDEDLEFAFARRGVMELVDKAKKAGKIRFVGITGHTTPSIMNKIAGMYAFDTILIPLSVADGANKAKSFERETLPLVREKGMGVIAMKTLGAGAVLKQNAASLEEALRYAWSLPISTAVLGCQSPEQVRADVALAKSAKPLTAAEMDSLRQRTGQFELAELEPWKGLTPRTEYRGD